MLGNFDLFGVWGDGSLPLPSQSLGHMPRTASVAFCYAVRY